MNRFLSRAAVRMPGSPRFLPASLAASTLAAAQTLAADAVDPARLPAPAGRPISFSADVQPILDRSCLRCHGAVRPKGGFRLDNRESALQGGDQGAAIQPGNSAASPLIHHVARLDPETAMPPDGKGDPLTAGDVGILRAWIDQGASWGDATQGPQVDFHVEPAIQFVSVSGNAGRFREHTWMRDGWGGGLRDFSLRYDTDPRTHVRIDGRALRGPDDYRLTTRVTRDDLGWVRFEYREFSRWHDDIGGHFAPLGAGAPSLGDELVTRRRQATFEAGLELPDLPRIRLAYDLRLRDGTESTLHWGTVTDGVVHRAIFPGRKRVDETTHLITLDLDYDWDGLLISNEAQFEWHDQDNTRTSYEQANGGFPWTTLTTDRQDYWRGANALRLERSLRDWLYVSGGYLYSQLRDQGGFNVTGFNPADPTIPPSIDRNADDLTLRRRAHVINGNAMLGPWEHLHFYAGLQADWSRQESFAAGRTFGLATSFDANLDRVATDEHFGLRYAGLPNTVVFAETRFQQESFSHFEEGLTGGAQEFLRDTDATGDLKDYEAGFTVSPWTVASFQAKVRHRERSNHYDHLREIDLLSSGNGYPAFIRDRDTTGDEIETRLVLQPARWLKTTLKYAWSTTEFETATAPWDDLSSPAPVTVPAARITAGDTDTHAVSAGFVVTPWRRLHLASTVGWSTSRTRSGVNNDLEVVPYEGDGWNLLNSATLVVDEKTDLLASYLFSVADYSQDNAASGLPLGIEYTRHALTAGISRRMKHDRTLRLEYGYFTHDEPTLGGAADYIAHALFASLRIPWK